MGSGKGNPEYWAVVKPGRVLFEVAGVSRAQAEEALRRAAMKMPMDCRFIERQHIGVASTGGGEQGARGGSGMKPAEIRAMDNEKLNQQVADLLAEWRSLRFKRRLAN